MNSIYFDNAATTQMRKEVVDRMTEVMRDVPGNPSSTHAFGRTAKSQIETSRKRIAELFNVSAGEIIFTVSLMHVNNEIGNMIDIKAIATLCKSHGALVHSDMVQSVGHYELDLQEIPVDFIAAAAHKFHGPKGVGFAFVRKNSGLKPLIFGGSQERGLRAGTEAVHNIVGLEEALNMSYKNLKEESAYVKGLKSYFAERLKKEIPNVKLNGNCNDSQKSTYTLLNVCLPIVEEKAVLLLFQLDMKGIACSKGSACQSGSIGGSHVLKEILSDEDFKKPSLRFSFSIYNTKEEVDYVVDVLKEYIESENILA